jgi:hypothetical protein
MVQFYSRVFAAKVFPAVRFLIMFRISPKAILLLTTFLEEYNFPRNEPLLPRLHLTARPQNLRSDVLYCHL